MNKDLCIPVEGGVVNMKKVLVTGGTVFVSRYIAEYYVAKGYEVYVLNRGSREQSKGVTLIEADRHNLGEILREYSFDVIVDTAYNANDGIYRYTFDLKTEAY